jgi:uncharacterized Tic20 family protein
MEWNIVDENMLEWWTYYRCMMKKYTKSSRQDLSWAAMCPLNHAIIVIFKSYVSRLSAPPFLFCTTSKDRDNFALSMSLSTQAKLWMNFQVSILMKYNPPYTNNSIVLNDSSTTTQTQNHYMSCLCPKLLKNESFMESFMESFISVFLLVKTAS